MNNTPTPTPANFIKSLRKKALAIRVQADFEIRNINAQIRNIKGTRNRTMTTTFIESLRTKSHAIRAQADFEVKNINAQIRNINN